MRPTDASPIRVCITGVAGRMGGEVARTVLRDSGFELVSAVDKLHTAQPLHSILGTEKSELVIERDLTESLARSKPHVLVDFTHPESGAKNAMIAIEHDVAPIIGTSGISEDMQKVLRRLCTERSVPGMIVPNFAIGAVLMMRFAEIAAKWMPQVEIVEMHHDQKLDAPSGTAISTAKRIAMARISTPKDSTKEIKFEGARGAVVDGVSVHSLRLNGLVAHQMVMLGGQGETLTIRHDSLDRSSFMEGVSLCIRKVWGLQELTIGLDSLIFE